MAYFHSEKPPERIKIERYSGPYKIKAELPLRLLVVGDFSLTTTGVPLGERAQLSINKENFNQVMESCHLSLKISVRNCLADGNQVMQVELKFTDLESFHPDELIKQVPALAQFLALRNLLQANLSFDKDIRKELQEFIQEPELANNFLKALQKLKSSQLKSSSVSPVAKQQIVEKPEITLDKNDEQSTVLVEDLLKLADFSKLEEIHFDYWLRERKPFDLLHSIDSGLSAQLDEILHHPQFQQLESSWRSLKFLVERTDFSKNVEIVVIDVSKEALRQSFAEAPELNQSGLYRHLYHYAYDTHGGIPYAAIIANYEFDHSVPDLILLQEIAKVAASVQAPFIGAVGPQFFGMTSWREWSKAPNKQDLLETTDYAAWHSFRKSEESRFIGLTFPRFLLRLPYGPDTAPIKSFNYSEKGPDSYDSHVWGNASFAVASNLVRAFINDGWCVQIRGPKAGGMVDNLLIYEEGGRHIGPIEILINDFDELYYASMGFIPFLAEKGKGRGCFYSASSVQKPTVYDSPDMKATSHVNARLPYTFLGSRFFHYLKVHQRDNMGANCDPAKLESEFNSWLHTLVTEMRNPPEAMLSRRPLRAAQVQFTEMPSAPNFCQVDLTVLPYFQIEGLDTKISIRGKFPRRSA